MLSKNWLLVFGVLLAAACAKPVTDPKGYPGAPLATFKGQLQVAPGGDNPGKVRLALAWYNDYYDNNPSNPNSLITEDVVYQGTFPVDFSLDLTTPPPAGALALPDGGTSHTAYALLIAYADVNGDGKLNPIPKGGPVIDKVLGASASFFAIKDSYWIYYSDGEIPANWPAGTKKGFNLVHDSFSVNTSTESIVDPRSVSIPIVLSGENELNALICTADYVDFLINGQPSPNPLAFCGIPATPGKLRYSTFVDRTVDDGLGTADDHASVQLSDGLNWVTGATITVNGQALAISDYDPTLYDLDDPTGTLLPPDAPVSVSISAPGFETINLTLPVQAQSALLTPAVNATVSASAPLPVSWTAAPSLLTSVIAYGSTDDQFYFQPSLFDAETSTTLPALGFSGTGTLQLSMQMASLSDLYGSTLVRHGTVTRPVSFGP